MREIDDHFASKRLSAAVLTDLACERSVSVVVTLDGTGPGRTGVYEIAGAELAAWLATLLRCGGWRSIRVEPLSADGPHGLFMEP